MNDQKANNFYKIKLVNFQLFVLNALKFEKELFSNGFSSFSVFG